MQAREVEERHTLGDYYLTYPAVQLLRFYECDDHKF